MVEVNAAVLEMIHKHKTLIPRPGAIVSESTASLEPMHAKEACVGEAIRILRKERGMSQQELAKRAGINRTTIARIETGVFKSLSLHNLEQVAEGLGLDLSTLLLKAESIGESYIHRGNVNKVEFVLDYPEEGFRISSLLPKRKEFFFGKIELQPRATATTKKLPHAEQICIHTMDGKVLLTRGGRDYLLKTGECSGFSGLMHYELYNPSQIHVSTAFFVSYPSFI